MLSCQSSGHPESYFFLLWPVRRCCMNVELKGPVGGCVWSQRGALPQAPPTPTAVAGERLAIPRSFIKTLPSRRFHSLLMYSFTLYMHDEDFIATEEVCLVEALHFNSIVIQKE